MTYSSRTEVLVTGGAGYIGSTVCSALEDTGFIPVVLDSLTAGHKSFLAGRAFYQGDIADARLLKEVFERHKHIEAAIHCAALTVVPESMSEPFSYYHENFSKSLAFFKSIVELGCKRVIFSSSAAIYAATQELVATETSPIVPGSPYGRTKRFVELAFADLALAHDAHVLALRYFNPLGADPSLRSGTYIAKPTHVIGKLMEVATGISPHFTLTGTSWPTRDGSGLRDFIHVWDLAQAHVLAVRQFAAAFSSAGDAGDTPHFRAINIGTGHGCTVRELIRAFQHVLGRGIEVKEAEARSGDVAGACASRAKAERLLGWVPKLTLDEAISDALKWESVRESVLARRVFSEESEPLGS